MGSDNLSIRNEMLRSAKWNALSMGVRAIVLFSKVVILARFLQPKDYGTAALANSSTGLFMLMTQFGFAQAIIGVRELDKKLVDSLFTTSLLLAIVLYGALVVASPSLAEHYQNPQLPAFLHATGIGLFLALGTAIPSALMQRNLDYRHQSVMAQITAIFPLIGSLWMASTGYGAWSLVIPPLIGSAFGGAYAFYVCKYLPRLKLDWKKLKPAFSFGLSALVSNFTNFAANNSVVLVMGGVWGSQTLGIYSFADERYGKPYDLISGQIAGSLFPIFSRVGPQKDRLANAYLKITQLGLYSIVPIYLIAIMGAPVFFPFLFGAQWDASIRLFQVLCIMPIARVFCLGANPVLYAMQKPHLSAKIATLRMIGILCTVFAFSAAHASLAIFGMGIVGVEIITIIVYAWASLTILGKGIRNYLKGLLPGLLMNSVFFVALYCGINLLKILSSQNMFWFFALSSLLFSVYCIVTYRYFLNGVRS